ncbi:hypothetical protein ACFQX8_15820 [Klenkia terrae]|uniref:hypothetical protein n=1 Tax=Klenkia terrae TaxID=1052259 RepID=UPI00360FB4DD
MSSGSRTARRPARPTWRSPPTPAPSTRATSSATACSSTPTPSPPSRSRTSSPPRDAPAPSGAGIPCLKDYRETTFTRTPDGICDGTYTGAPGESAGMIIWKVGQACGISPKVLLVLLQKEQALLTATGAGLTARRYQIAAGMGCPDTAACDTQYYGFYNQVYSAARQYQRYATYPRNYSYRAGATNTVYWSPTASCGTSQVYIANQATAGLYNYTPTAPTPPPSAPATAPATPAPPTATATSGSTSPTGSAARSPWGRTPSPRPTAPAVARPAPWAPRSPA